MCTIAPPACEKRQLDSEFEDSSTAEHIVSTRAMWLNADDKAGI